MVSEIDWSLMVITHTAMVTGIPWADNHLSSSYIFTEIAI